MATNLCTRRTWSLLDQKILNLATRGLSHKSLYAKQCHLSVSLDNYRLSVPISRHSSHSVYIYEDISVKLVKNYGSANGMIDVKQFLKDLKSTGILEDDPRLVNTLTELKNELSPNNETIMEKDKFIKVIGKDMHLIEMALKGKFVVEEFETMTDKIKEIYEECIGITEGKNASYIPELANVDPSLWGVSLCTVSGQRFSVGNSDSLFTIQSGGKCFTYPIALDELGEDQVHKYVGMEPSGGHFNKMVLNYSGKPHNPMINSGAMMLCSLVNPQDSLHRRVSFMLERFSEIAGVQKQSIKFDMVTCDSEIENAERNHALLYYMKSKNAFPKNTSLDDTIKLYTRLCSIETNTSTGSVMAATLANGGVCPITSTKALSSDSVTKTLTLMHSCGMYDYSGEFGYNVGLPGKSGVSGVICLVIPNLMGLCMYSPPVNNNGNSVRGLHFCRKLVEQFNFHVYDSTRVKSNKMDPRNYRGMHKELEVTSVMYAARTGAISSLQRYLMSGIDLSQCDYDGRTPLHIAATYGHLNTVKFLVERARVHHNPTDEWNNTPLDNAIQFGQQSVINYLKV